MEGVKAQLKLWKLGIKGGTMDAKRARVKSPKGLLWEEGHLEIPGYPSSSYLSLVTEYLQDSEKFI
jgi:hypothetical protein